VVGVFAQAHGSGDPSVPAAVIEVDIDTGGSESFAPSSTMLGVGYWNDRDTGQWRPFGTMGPPGPEGPPAIPTGVSRRLTVDGTYTVPAAAWTPIAFDTTKELAGDIAVTGAGTIIVNVPGLYLVSGGVNWPPPATGDTAASRRMMGVSLNGDSYSVLRVEGVAPTTAGGSRNLTLAGSVVQRFAAEDVLRLDAFQSSAAAVNLTTLADGVQGNFFDVWKIG
jgi:hypothetical protein